MNPINTTLLVNTYRIETASGDYPMARLPELLVNFSRMLNVPLQAQLKYTHFLLDSYMKMTDTELRENYWEKN